MQTFFFFVCYTIWRGLTGSWHWCYKGGGCFEEETKLIKVHGVGFWRYWHRRRSVSDLQIFSTHIMCSVLNMYRCCYSSLSLVHTVELFLVCYTLSFWFYSFLGYFLCRLLWWLCFFRIPQFIYLKQSSFKKKRQEICKQNRICRTFPVFKRSFQDICFGVKNVRLGFKNRIKKPPEQKKILTQDWEGVRIGCFVC